MFMWMRRNIQCSCCLVSLREGIWRGNLYLYNSLPINHLCFWENKENIWSLITTRFQEIIFLFHDTEVAKCNKSCGCWKFFLILFFWDMFPQFQAGALDKLEAFTSFNGPDFYGLPRNTSKIVLRKSAWKVPATYKHSSGEIVPMFTGSTLHWLPSDQPEE